MTFFMSYHSSLLCYVMEPRWDGEGGLIGDSLILGCPGKYGHRAVLYSTHRIGIAVCSVPLLKPKAGCTPTTRNFQYKTPSFVRPHKPNSTYLPTYLHIYPSHHTYTPLTTHITSSQVSIYKLINQPVPLFSIYRAKPPPPPHLPS